MATAGLSLEASPAQLERVAKGLTMDLDSLCPEYIEAKAGRRNVSWAEPTAAAWADTWDDVESW